MTDKIVVLNTCGSEAEAERLARLLVDRRLAACVSILPRLRSFYRWNGVVESEEEWLLLIKSSRPLFEALRAALESGHSYEVPEVLALPVVDGAAAYLDWLQASLEASPAVDSTADPTVDLTADSTADPTANLEASPEANSTVEPTTDLTTDLTTDPTANSTANSTANPTANPTEGSAAE